MTKDIVVKVGAAFAARAFDDAIPCAHLKATPRAMMTDDGGTLRDLEDGFLAVRLPDGLQALQELSRD